MYCHPFLYRLHSLGRAQKQARALSGVIHVRCSTNDLASQSPLDDALCRSHLYLSVIGYVLRRLCVLINRFIRKSNCVVRAFSSKIHCRHSSITTFQGIYRFSTQMVDRFLPLQSNCVQSENHYRNVLLEALASKLCAPV
jgi:hypothetical protein